MDPYGLRYLYAGYSHHTSPYRTGVEHRHDGLLLRLQVKGFCKIAVSGKEHAIGPGDLVCVKPGETYQLTIGPNRPEAAAAAPDSADYFLACGGEWVDEWRSHSDIPHQIRIEMTEELLSFWRKLIYEKRDLHGDNSEMLACVVKLLCLTIERLARKARAAAERNDGHVAYKLKQYIEAHATEPLTLARISAQCGVSVSTASHLFKQAFGQPPMRYAVEVRLAIACDRILYSEMRLEDIAEASGFRSYPYFSRAFRARFRMSPSKYRAVNRPE
ncbi:helix-turn-helix domain-containing protein [Paenibacillus arenilitoris]|uniref:Helix-turn-helix transcriptional regulator n=1 Tax=Paenibacillus arenilitoris TaxID=2772299 RepID=A0A927H568_9BACL|nr:AraC family transcriptional regulator [Paenibacillus arenilitoris]MBD2868625.1 helix-turn-helix transcriptional regulator [Paenibacillus arenilitoris]